MWITSMVSMGALYLTGCLSSSEALAGFSNSNTILMACMFMVAAGFQRSSFVNTLCTWVMKFSKGSFTKVYAAYIILAAILTNLIPSPLTVFYIVAPMLGALCDSTGVSRSKVMFPLLVVSVTCCGVLPFASAINHASQANSYMGTYGFTQSVSAVDFFIGKAPMFLLLPLWAIFLGPKFSPDQPVIPIATMGNKTKEQKPLTPFQDKAAIIARIDHALSGDIRLKPDRYRIDHL